MGAVDLQVVEQGQRVAAGDRLGVALGVVRDVGRREAARVVGHAAEVAREEAHLRLPATVVARKLVDEEQRRAGAGVFEIEPRAVPGVRMWHEYLHYHHKVGGHKIDDGETGETMER
jgi:hypothetical protein